MESKKKTSKWKDGYYFRVAHPPKVPERQYLDSMAIVKDGKIEALYNCIFKEWHSGPSQNYDIGTKVERYVKISAFKLEFMGDL